MVATFLHVLLVVLSFCVHVYMADSECDCFVSGTVMDCSYRKCRDSKPSCAEDTTVLKMTGNGITHLPSGYFETCITARIEEVYLDNNNISEIDKDAFQGLEEINYVDLSGNNISAFDLDLQYTEKLTNLSLAGNPLQTFTFHGTDTLKNLNLSSCQLPSDDNIVSSLGDLRKLTTLDLSSNNLTNWGEITKYVVKMKELQLLYVADNPWLCECPRDEATTEKMKGLVDGGVPKCASPDFVNGTSLWNYTCPTTTTTPTTTSSTNTIPPTPTTESENITMDTNTNTTNTNTTNTTPAPNLQASNLNEASVYGATAFFFVVIVAALFVELHARIVKKRAGDNSLWWQDEDRVNGSAMYKYENIFPDD